MSIIALITDFGTADHFVGSMKGAILAIDPKATLVDITHAIAPGDVPAAAISLLLSFADFPRGTIFVVVVDPGVGGDRKALAIKAGPYCFVGPDNGVLSLACNNAGKPIVRSLENARYFRKPVSTTFHGRDIFGPVAASLSKGVAFEKLGPEKESFVLYKTPQVFLKSNRVHGEVLYIDGFGNCITTIEAKHLVDFNSRQLWVKLKNQRPFPVCSRYSDVPKGKALGIIGSAGFLEISINRENSAKKLTLKIGAHVEIFG
jgi:S-adenosyl-L-methionine hydrolase (adenosine-forming)